MAEPAHSIPSFDLQTAERALPPGWELTEAHTAIHKRYRFKNFAQALAFVNALGAEAEEVNHHPDLTLGWGYVGVTLTTHDAGGLTANDFTLAAKAELLFGTAH